MIIKKQVYDTNQKKYLDNFDDLITYIIIGVIVGGRLGYIIFYNPIYYIENFLKFLNCGKEECPFMEVCLA